MNRHYAIRSFFWALALALTGAAGADAQILTPGYPAAAQGLTRGLDQSTLTVQIGFSSSCANDTVTVSFPASVSYVPGSVAAIGGTLSGAAVTEAGIANLNAPKFSISGVSGAGDIIFTLRRQADCGALAGGKDTIRVSGNCGSASEAGATVNTYNILYPAISITPPAAITGAFVGDPYSRSATITNGGNGCTDTLRLCLVYLSGGMALTSTGNAINANGIDFIPWKSNGDTLFYKIWGSSLFGGDSLLCNGETVTITEPVKLLKCGAATTYMAYWGRNPLSGCQLAVATSAVTMATGAASPGVSGAEPVIVGACNAGTLTATFSNAGSGGKAGAMYNVTASLGFVSSGQLTMTKGSGFTISNATISGNALFLTQSGNNPYQGNTSQFTSDPDGAGLGLDDLDGDGQYDDLAPGKSFTVSYTRTYVLNNTACPGTIYADQPGALVSYASMCGSAASTIRTVWNNYYYSSTATSSVTSPPQVNGGQTFSSNISFSLIKTMMPAQSVDSSELNITLPAGFSYAGNAKFNGNAAQYALQTGQVLQIRQKGYASVEYFSFDLQYTCGTAGAYSVSYELDYVMDRSCNAFERWVCGSYAITTVCGSACGYIDNGQPQCTRLTLGFTDSTLTTKVSAASLSPASLITVMPMDSFRLIHGGREGAAYANLNYFFQAGKANAAADVIQFVSGTLNYKPGGTGAAISCALPAPASGSTATLTRYSWNLTPLLGSGCGLPSSLAAGDSVWIDVTFFVSNGGNSSLLYGATLNQLPNAQCYFYNLDAGGNPVYCNAWIPNLYITGVAAANVSLGTANYSFTGCTATNITIFDKVGLVGDNYDIFPGEWRPTDRVDTLVVTLPAGASWSGASCTYSARRWSSRFSNVSYLRGIMPAVRNNQLVFLNPGTYPYSDMFATTSTGSSITIPIIASCAFVGGDVAVDLYARESYYAPANTTQRHPVYTSPGGFVYNSTLRPALSLQNNTGLVQGVLVQHYWDVQINNPSTRSAPYVWMSLEPVAGSGISIDSVVLKPSNLVLTPAAYGTGSKWYAVGVSGLMTGANQAARIYVKTTRCSLDSILMKAGWNCTTYPSPDPAADANACGFATQFLKVDPQPSEIQLSVLRQPGNGSPMSLCATDSVLVTVNSAQSGYIIGPWVDVYPPPGSAISLPVQIEYPLGSGNYQNAATTAVAGGYKIDLSAHTGIGANGIPGVVTNPGAAGRQAKIRVNFATDCSISSGAPLNFFAYASMPCLQPATGNAVNVQTSGISITGASATGGMGLTIAPLSSNLTCGQSTTLNLSATPVLTATQTGDTVVYDLGNGLAYAGGFTTGANCASCSVLVISGTSTNLVKVALGTGVSAGSAMLYSFSIAPNGTGCGISNVVAIAKRDISPLYCGATACGGSTAAIGSAVSGSISSVKPNLSITGLQYVSGLFQPGATPTVALTVANNGAMNAAAATYQVEFFCGNNALPFTTATFPPAVNTGSSASSDFTLSVPAAPACSMGNTITARIRSLTSALIQQCLCSEASMSSSVALPVALSGFSVQSRDCTASLEWQMPGNINTAAFNIERSTDGVLFARRRTNVAKSGSAYSAADTALPVEAVIYYRIQGARADGSTFYSQTVPLNKPLNCGEAAARIYPNPAAKDVWITARAGTASYTIADELGRIQMTGTLQNGEGHIDIGHLPAGVYSVKIIRAGGLSVYQLNIVR